MDLQANECAQTASQQNIEKASGTGGVFFGSVDHAALQAWYEKHLGIAKVPSSYDVEPWSQESGPTVFAPFPEATDYFGKREQQWMVNFRPIELWEPKRPERRP